MASLLLPYCPPLFAPNQIKQYPGEAPQFLIVVLLATDVSYPAASNTTSLMHTRSDPASRVLEMIVDLDSDCPFLGTGNHTFYIINGVSYSYRNCRYTTHHGCSFY